MDNLTEYLAAGGVILGALLVIAKAVSKLTANTKDDEIVAKAEEVLGPLLDSDDE